MRSSPMGRPGRAVASRVRARARMRCAGVVGAAFVVLGATLCAAAGEA